MKPALYIICFLTTFWAQQFSAEIPEFYIWHFLWSMLFEIHLAVCTVINRRLLGYVAVLITLKTKTQFDWLGDSSVSTENRRLLWLAIQSNQRRVIWWKELLKNLDIRDNCYVRNIHCVSHHYYEIWSSVTMKHILCIFISVQSGKFYQIFLGTFRINFQGRNSTAQSTLS
jgi:hypothetical protein